MTNKPTKKDLAKALLNCQSLFGEILTAYANDRNPMRADEIHPFCIKVESMCIDILGKFPQEYSA